MAGARGKRRRVVRRSDAENIDRSMDSPRHGFEDAETRPDDRHVELDGQDVGEDATAESPEELLEQERPPHHGG